MFETGEFERPKFDCNNSGALLFLGLEKMTEAAPPDDTHKEAPMKELATSAGTHSVQPKNEIEDPMESPQVAKKELQKTRSLVRNDLDHFLTCHDFGCLLLSAYVLVVYTPGRRQSKTLHNRQTRIENR